MKSPWKIFPVLLFFLSLAAAMGFAQDKFRLKPGASGKVCLECHDTFKGKLQRRYVHTPVKSGECSGCHNPHSSSHGKLLEADPSRICMKCHGDVLPEKARSTHRVVSEGKCVACHDPHSADHKYNLLKGGNDICVTCHKDTVEGAAKAKFPHRPVGQGCIGCHDPHASVSARYILKEEVPAICLRCHSSEKPAFAQAHMNYPVARADCGQCHDAHGSERPGILFKNVHAPVANRLCNQCHEAADSLTPFGIKRKGMDLCRGCHSNKINEFYDKNRMHGPVIGKEACVRCHAPHASSQKGLIRGPMIKICGECHSDTIIRQERSLTKHEPILKGECTSCHEPHAANGAFLLGNDNVVALCQNCHDWLKHSTHPLGEKYADPRNRNISIDCLSCHRSHGTEYKKMMPFATVSELCTQCHTQFTR